MTSIISINDNNLLIQHNDSVASYKGYAWLLDDQVHFDFDQDTSAINVCRLHPQQIQNRYWQQCAQTSISANNSLIRHSADLVWQQLSAMQSAHDLEQVVFVVPSHYQAENLQLLLGIANSSDLQPQGLINKAVLVTQHHAQADGHYLHVDLQLHQTVCSLVEVAQGSAKLRDVDTVNDVSIQSIQDALLKQMQQNFIQTDRFDPLHYAETEQQLFDQIDDVAAHLARDGKTNVTVQHGSNSYSIALDRSQWNSVIEPFAQKILSLGKTQHSPHFLLQLNKLFDGAVPSPFKAKNATMVDDMMRIRSDLSGLNDADDGLSYCLELPLINYNSVSDSVDTKVTTKPQSAPKANTDSQTATHLMQLGLAVPLQHAVIELTNGQLALKNSSLSNVDSLLKKEHVFILNEPSRRVIHLNDRIGSNHADGVITAIQVLE